jgi:hypothetical protein
MRICTRGIAILLVALCLTSFAAAAPNGVRTFSSPEEAVKALYAALKSKDQDALLAIFGQDFKKVQVQSGAERAATHDRLVRLLKEGWSLTTTQDQSRVIRMGYEGWSFPIPIIKRGSLWQFDTYQGLQELANRVVGRDELMAIDTFNVLHQAQDLYHQQDRDGNGKAEYASKLLSSPQAKDGLYWQDGGSDPSPLAQVIGNVADFTATRSKGAPWFGYYYDLRPTGDGYIFTAWPATYGKTGVMSFWSDQAGRVYQKDLGAKAGSFLRSVSATSNLQGWDIVP